MTKLVFLAHGPIFDADLFDMLGNALQTIVEADRDFQFLLPKQLYEFSCFSDVLLRYVRFLNLFYPQKNIELILADYTHRDVDAETELKAQRFELDARRPAGAGQDYDADWTSFCFPRRQRNTNTVVPNHEQTVFYRCLMELSDWTVCYAYDAVLPLLQKKRLNRAMRSPKFILLADGVTRDLLLRAADAIDVPKRNRIYREVLLGKKVSVLAKELGVTKSAVMGQYAKARRQIIASSKIRYYYS